VSEKELIKRFVILPVSMKVIKFIVYGCGLGVFIIIPLFANHHPQPTILLL